MAASWVKFVAMTIVRCLKHCGEELNQLLLDLFAIPLQHLIEASSRDQGSADRPIIAR
jgi:hypothetical protein